MAFRESPKDVIAGFRNATEGVPYRSTFGLPVTIRAVVAIKLSPFVWAAAKVAWNHFEPV